MKRNLLVVLLFFVAIFTFGAVSHAAVVGWGDNYMVSKDSSVNSNLYVGAQQITLVGDVLGDALGAGGNVFVNNTIQGDALLMGGSINVLSTVEHNLRLVGNSLVVSGKIGGDLAAIGNSIRIVEGNNASIGGDLLLAGNSIMVSAPVSGSVKISGADVTLNGKVDGDVRVVADKLHIGPNAVISGNLSYKSVREAEISPTAKVYGNTNFEKVKATGPDSDYFSVLWDSLFWVKVISFFVISMILYVVGDKSMTTLSLRARENPWQNLFAGILFFIGVPISTVLLIVTVIGLPIAVAVVGLGIIFAITAIAFMPILVGTTIKIWLKKGSAASWKVILLGSFVLVIIGFIPVIGSITKTILFLISEGVMIRIALEKLQKIRA